MKNVLTENIFTDSTSFKRLEDFFLSNSFTQTFVLVDENTNKYCYPLIASLLPSHHFIEIKSGEENKTLSTCELIWNKLTAENADRNILLINLGGGVIGDLGGFAAGCYKRGIAFIQIPTTLLAMVDASVGGKTGIDFNGFKNQIGLFHQPEAVFIHTPFLKTLKERELLSGFAEVIKHYLIADKTAFNQLETLKPQPASSAGRLTTFDWNSIVKRNVNIKSFFVEHDPREKHIRKALNFGHTVGHAIETYFLKLGNEKLLHGEAIAIGMICESFLSEKMNLITALELVSVSTLLLDYFKLPSVPESSFDQILKLMKQDKKNKDNQFQFTLLKGIGNYSIDNSVEESMLIESLNYYNCLVS
ncbi:MAG: 3-dehydroquinate synthase [Bacteroidetes bacterium]|nr:3-dehydroquinate synthase [Bacteroidota bacterium]